MNIGGISNVTIIEDYAQNNLKSRDLGPGNCLIDAWVRKNKKGNFDEDGAFAAMGKTNDLMLNQALDNFDKNDYLNSNLVIEKISNDFSGYKKWTGKSLLLMSKNFYQLGDAFQATFILESVIENFGQMPDIVEEAKKNLLQIKEIESKKNSSVEINN